MRLGNIDVNQAQYLSCVNTFDALVQQARNFGTDTKWTQWRFLFENQFKFINPCCWKCEYISPEALVQLHKNKCNAGLERGHAAYPSHIPVKQNILRFIENWDRQNPEVAIDEFIASDNCTILTKEQNKNDHVAHDAVVLPVELFEDSGRNFRYTKAEKAWVARALLAKI